jgi:hypothetical protein
MVVDTDNTDQDLISLGWQLLGWLRAGLRPYVLQSYEKAYGDRRIAEIASRTRTFNDFFTADDSAVLDSLDVQGWLDLVVKNRDLFRTDLGPVGLAYASEMLDFRTRLAHQKPITLADFYRAADTAHRLLVLAQADDAAQDAETLKQASLLQMQAQVQREEEAEAFSYQIRTQLERVKRIVTDLTRDQYQILDWLRGHKRVAIAGCAGSGKTLLAAEKAIRLDRAGLRTLILCHNPHLAQYLSHLTAGTGVRTVDFVNWVALVRNVPIAPIVGWTPYEEPTDDELADAIRALESDEAKYDAIIVDEGQDFRDSWWAVVESALADSATGILYVFHDDNQALIPRHLQYPIKTAPYSLRKNCRNAGEIFELVRRFHPQAPETVSFLDGTGVVVRSPIRPEGEKQAVSSALMHALNALSFQELVVLTTEPEPAELSALNGLEVVTNGSETCWQEVVRRSLGTSHLPLSNDAYPNQDDIQIVANYARSRQSLPQSTDAKALHQMREGARHGAKTIRWRLRDGQLSLSPLRYGSMAGPSPFLAFFSRQDWDEGLPKPITATVSAEGRANNSSHTPTIPLFTVGTFKGLEADGVILFIRSPRNELEANLYVGVSRAVGYLNIVADPAMLTRVLGAEAV